MYATGYKSRRISNSTGATQNQGIKWNALYDGTKANVDIDLVNNGDTRHYSTTLNDRQFASLYNDVLLQPANPLPLEQRLLNDFNIQPAMPLLMPAPSPTRRHRKRKQHRRTHKRSHSSSATPPPKAKSPIIYTPPTPIYSSS